MDRSKKDLIQVAKDIIRAKAVAAVESPDKNQLRSPGSLLFRTPLPVASSSTMSRHQVAGDLDMERIRHVLQKMKTTIECPIW